MGGGKYPMGGGGYPRWTAGLIDVSMGLSVVESSAPPNWNTGPSNTNVPCVEGTGCSNKRVGPTVFEGTRPTC